MKKFKKISAVLLIVGSTSFFPLRCTPPDEYDAQVSVEQQTGVDAIQIVDINKL